MAIRLSRGAEPLSAMSSLEPGELIESDASRLLYQEMLGYCQGRINGRSLLISGHRGAGKTTMVAGAYLKTRKRSEIDRVTMRPLLVQLNGTTLLPGTMPDDSRSSPPAARPWYESQAQRGADAQVEANEALVQITLCLFRALAKEVAREFRRKVVVDPVSGRALSGSRLRDRLELAAQLEIELYECPEPSRLRSFWQRAGLLGTTSQGLFQAPFWRKRPQDEMGQGLRELVAISGAAEAFRRISGTLSQRDTATHSAEEKQEVVRGTEISGKSLLEALIALLGGGLVGAGILAGSGGAVPSALGGIAAALAGAAVFKVQHSRSRARAHSRESSFLFDMSVTTLDRALPILIERLHEAGVAPVFVVDELDKVDDLRRRMGGLVRYLKLLVADQAFFCFLTDRAYFEDVQRHEAGTPYPVEYTYFTHQLYVIFSASDLHDYLDRIASWPGSDVTAATPLPPWMPAPAISVPQAQQVVRRSDDEADWAVLGYALLHRAKMHSLDLHRELIEICNESAEVALEPGDARTRRSFGHEVLLQVAVEMRLASPTLAARIERAPEFRRIAHDALYYVSRCWERFAPLALADADKSIFERYLSERTGVSVDRPDSVAPCDGQDLDMLFAEVRELAAMVAGDREKFLEQFDRWLREGPTPSAASGDREGAGQQARAARRSRMDQVVRDILVTADPLLAGTPATYTWRYDASGNLRVAIAAPQEPAQEPPREPATALRTSEMAAAAAAKTIEKAVAASDVAPTTAGSPRDWRADRDLIQGVADLLSELCTVPVGDFGSSLSFESLDFNLLATQVGVLMTSPAWPVAQRSLADLAEAEQAGRPFEETDLACIREFALMLMRSGGTLALALAWAARVGWAAPPAPRGQRLLMGLGVLAHALRLADLTPAEVLSVLVWLGTTVPEGLPPRLALDADPPELAFGSAREWVTWVRERVTETADPEKVTPINSVHLLLLSDEAWKNWLGRLDTFFTTGTVVFPPPLADLLCVPAGIGPSQLLDFQLERMAIVDWSAVLLLAISPARPKLGPEPGANRLAPYALSALGFEPPIWLERLGKAFPHLARIPVSAWAAKPFVWKPSPVALRLLIVRRPTGSLVTSLRLSGAGAAVSVSLSDLRGNDRSALQRLVKALRIEWIVAEEPFDQGLISHLAGDVARVVPLGAQPPPVPPSGGYIVAPTTIEEIASYLGSLVDTPQS